MKGRNVKKWRDLLPSAPFRMTISGGWEGYKFGDGFAVRLRTRITSSPEISQGIRTKG